MFVFLLLVACWFRFWVLGIFLVILDRPTVMAYDFRVSSVPAASCTWHRGRGPWAGFIFMVSVSVYVSVSVSVSVAVVL